MNDSLNLENMQNDTFSIYTLTLKRIAEHQQHLNRNHQLYAKILFKESPERFILFLEGLPVPHQFHLLTYVTNDASSMLQELLTGDHIEKVCRLIEHWPIHMRIMTFTYHDFSGQTVFHTWNALIGRSIDEETDLCVKLFKRVTRDMSLQNIKSILRVINPVNKRLAWDGLQLAWLESYACQKALANLHGNSANHTFVKCADEAAIQITSQRLFSTDKQRPDGTQHESRGSYSLKK